MHAALYRLKISTTYFAVSFDLSLNNKKEYFVIGVYGEGKDLQIVSYASLNSRNVIGYESKDIQGQDL